jgi:hypothetical protein
MLAVGSEGLFGYNENELLHVKVYIDRFSVLNTIICNPANDHFTHPFNSIILMFNADVNRK